ncbi:hypothetical protein MUK42_08253 [Musa troglodytarum]|uniref:Uncharacterized protein n=1 Tax=Musa troglodytarum TaxID=320322 RepID=A0A9E7I4E9_9LILI|nr:hypothetical protein MUK42_08253 [Musa troglodytarum]
MIRRFCSWRPSEMLETATGSGVLPRELLCLLQGGTARGGRGAASGGGERFAADFFTSFHFGTLWDEGLLSPPESGLGGRSGFCLGVMAEAATGERVGWIRVPSLAAAFDFGDLSSRHVVRPPWGRPSNPFTEPVRSFRVVIDRHPTWRRIGRQGLDPALPYSCRWGSTRNPRA